MKDEEIFKLAIDTYGEGAQIDKAIEEMSELIKALLKLRYAKKDYEANIAKDAAAEEIADVQIMLKQLRMIFDFDSKVESYSTEKIERLARRLAVTG